MRDENKKSITTAFDQSGVVAVAVTVLRVSGGDVGTVRRTHDPLPISGSHHDRGVYLWPTSRNSDVDRVRPAGDRWGRMQGRFTRGGDIAERGALGRTWNLERDGAWIRLGIGMAVR